MTRVMAAAEGGETPNFLVPNATIFVVFVIFLLILFFFYRFVVPPLTKAMAERDEMNRKQAEDRDNAQRRLAEAEERYQKALAEARGEAGRIRAASLRASAIADSSFCSASRYCSAAASAASTCCWMVSWRVLTMLCTGGST